MWMRSKLELRRLIVARRARSTSAEHTSRVWSSRRPRWSKSRPAASYSSRCQPTPTPRSSRPSGQHVEGRGGLGEHDRTPQRGEQDAGREAHAFGHAGDDAQGRHRLEPVPVRSGGLAPAALAADLGTPVGVELLAEHDVVGEDEPVDRRRGRRGARSRASSLHPLGASARVRDERGRELRADSIDGATGRGATVTDGIESVAPPRSTASTTLTR